MIFDDRDGVDDWNGLNNRYNRSRVNDSGVNNRGRLDVDRSSLDDRDDRSGLDDWDGVDDRGSLNNRNGVDDRSRNNRGGMYGVGNRADDSGSGDGQESSENNLTGQNANYSPKL